MSGLSDFARGWVLRQVSASFIALVFLATQNALAQQPPSSKPAQPSAEQSPAPKGSAQPPKAIDEKSPQTPDVLVQLNSALEGLAAKVSPAVVQILVTGYGQLHEEDRSQTALIVRQHAVGSGVIVDRDGYIMTNAHVVEGAAAHSRGIADAHGRFPRIGAD